MAMAVAVRSFCVLWDPQQHSQHLHSGRFYKLRHPSQHHKPIHPSTKSSKYLLEHLRQAPGTRRCSLVALPLIGTCRPPHTHTQLSPALYSGRLWKGNEIYQQNPFLLASQNLLNIAKLSTYFWAHLTGWPQIVLSCILGQCSKKKRRREEGNFEFL